MTVLQHWLINMGRGWLVLWMLLVPLIHIHPDVAHSNGVHPHVHGAQYHSVFSEGQFSDFHDSLHSVHSHYPPSGSPSIDGDTLLDPVFNPPEIGFSFLSKAGENLLFPPAQEKFSYVINFSEIIHFASLAERSPSQGSPPNRLFVFQPRVRPPPFLSH